MSNGGAAKSPRPRVRKTGARASGASKSGAHATQIPNSQPEPSGEDPKPGDVWFSDMTKFWMDARQDLEGYALKYLSPSTPPNPMLAQDWMEDGANLVADLWSLWARGVTLTAVEGGRLVADALRAKDKRLAEKDPSGAP
jgi:hypothetical protein